MKHKLIINVETDQTKQEFIHNLKGIVEVGIEEIKRRGRELPEFNWDLKALNLDE